MVAPQLLDLSAPEGRGPPGQGPGGQLRSARLVPSQTLLWRLGRGLVLQPALQTQQSSRPHVRPESLSECFVSPLINT